MKIRMEFKNIKRILVIGCCGTGKSVFSKELGEKLNLEVFHLDRLFWKPGWVMREKDEFDNIVRNLILKDEWIIDGNYSRTLKVRAKRADMIFFFDYSSSFCVYRVLKRSLKTKLGIEKRTDLTEGCEEKWFDREFVKFVWNFRKKTVPENHKTLEELNFNKDRMFLFRKKIESNAFLRNLNLSE